MKFKFLIILTFLLFYTSLFSQIKDTINGNVKSIREQVIFLDENYQNSRLFNTDSDYGHSGFIDEKLTKNRFLLLYYNTPYVHYINYYKEFDLKKRLLKVIWYNNDSTILSSKENNYGSNGYLINEKLFSYNNSETTNKYDKNNNLISSINIDEAKNYTLNSYQNNKLSKTEYSNFEHPKFNRKTEYVYDNNKNLIYKKNYNENREHYSEKFKYDNKGRNVQIISHSPFIWIKKKKYSTQKRAKAGNDQLSKEFKYDNKDRIIETKSYNSDFYDGNKANLYERENKIYENDLLRSVQVYNHLDSLTYYQNYEYDINRRKIRESNIFPNYPENNIISEYFYSEFLYPKKLIYTEKDSKVIVDFEYVFDEYKNWIEQSKSINGKKLYVWKREIKYY